MKKLSVAVISISLAFALVVISTGCGGGVQDRARGYMNEGDRIIDSMESETTAFENQLEETFTTMASGRLTSSDKAEELLEDLRGVAREPVDKAEKAKAQYEKILQLDDAEDFKDYAELRIKVIDDIIEIVELTKGYLEDIGEVLAAAEAGQQIDLPQVESATTEFGEKVMKLREEIEKSGKEAEELQKELK